MRILIEVKIEREEPTTGIDMAEMCRNSSKDDGNCLPIRPSDRRRTTRLRPRHDPSQLINVIPPTCPSTYSPAVSVSLHPHSHTPMVTYSLAPTKPTSATPTSRESSTNPPKPKQTIPPHTFTTRLPAPVTHQASLALLQRTRMHRAIYSQSDPMHYIDPFHRDINQIHTLIDPVSQSGIQCTPIYTCPNDEEVRKRRLVPIEVTKLPCAA